MSTARTQARVRRIIAEAQREKITSLPTKEPMVGAFKRRTYVKICAVVITLTATFSTIRWIHSQYEAGMRILSRYDSPNMKLVGMKKIERFARFALPGKLQLLRDSNVFEFLMSFLVDTKEDPEVQAKALGLIALLLRDRLTREKALQNETFLLPLVVFLSLRDLNEAVVAAGTELFRGILVTEENISFLNQTRSGREVIEKLTAGGTPSVSKT
uniref:Armadillo repeat-containing domain-containing protein n=1 Tax=Rhodosorus marinus TaxID=101924 RepID=A0A7S0BMA6_9RHOD|mmetsp:Transcript_23118/g.33193  ORF Transcript_23118/g.33193 Transcript_23118/m.33193 type:complete len:214 (+) Transcript_23118:17-658(+)